MMRLIVLLIVFNFAHNSLAQVINGPLSRAQGGSGRAGLESSESALLNPALVPMAANHEVNFFYGDGYLDTNEHVTYYGLGATDNGEDVMVPGTLHYIRFRETGLGPSGVNQELWHFAVGRLAYQRISFGISGYRLVSDPDGSASKTQWNGSAGLLYIVNQELGFGYVVDNILEPSSNVPVYLRKTLRQSVGAMYSFAGMARMRLDITRDEKYNPERKMIYQAGFEAASYEWVTIRLGGKWDNLREQNFVTLGVGFNGPRLKVDYAFEKNTKHTGDAVHSVDMRIPF
jgi:hypothetical protein